MEKITLATTTVCTTHILLRTLLARFTKTRTEQPIKQFFLFKPNKMHYFFMKRLSVAGEPATMTGAWPIHLSILSNP